MNGGGKWLIRPADGTGYGEYRYSVSGDIYRGDCVKSHFNGEGVYTYSKPQGKVYTGTFKNDKKHGYGTQTWPSGDLYEGEWKDWKRTGHGRFVSKDGWIYTGHYQSGHMQGMGTQTFSADLPASFGWDGDVYDGEWAHDKRNGAGTHTFAANNRVHAGEFVNNRPVDKDKFEAVRTMPLRNECDAWSIGEVASLRDLFCKAATSGNCSLLLKLKEDFRVDPLLIGIGAEKTTVMDLVIGTKQANSDNLIGMLMGWQVNCTTYAREKWCSILLERAILLDSDDGEQSTGIGTRPKRKSSTNSPSRTSSRSGRRGSSSSSGSSAGSAGSAGSASKSMFVENAPAYIAAQLLAHDDAEAPPQHHGTKCTDEVSALSQHTPIVSRAGAIWLKTQWQRVEPGDAGCAAPQEFEWKMLYDISRIYFDGCIALAKPQSQTDLLRHAYIKTRDNHRLEYIDTAENITVGHVFDKYNFDLEGMRHRVLERYADSTVAQNSDDMWEVYMNARAIQPRYERFMTVLAAKSGCIYIAGALKCPFRAIEKCGLVVKGKQWKATKVKDIVRGAQEMPDVAKGHHLLKMLRCCDPAEGSNWAETAGVKEKIVMVGIKNRWIEPTSGGWSDALVTFFFEDDATKHICEVQLVHADMMRVRSRMEAHKGYTSFRCALELLEATGNVAIVEEIEERKKINEAISTTSASASPYRVATFGTPLRFGSGGGGGGGGGGDGFRGSTQSLTSRVSSMSSMEAINLDGGGGGGNVSDDDGGGIFRARSFSTTAAEELETTVGKLQATVAAQSLNIAQQAAEIERLQSEHADQVLLIEGQVLLVEAMQKANAVVEARCDYRLAALQDQILTIINQLPQSN